MMSTTPADPASVRLLNAYAALHGAASATSNSPISLTIDGKYQVRLRALPQGGIAVQARLRSLPESGPERDEMVLGVARLACGMMQEHGAACVVDDSERAIWLQQTSLVNSTQDIDDTVGSFVNCLAFWSKAIAIL